MPRRVLVIDDESAMRFTLEAVLGDAGFDVHTADGGAAGIADFEAHGADVVLTDLAMPDVDGMKVLATLRVQDPSVPVMMLTAHGSERVAVAAMKAGAFDYIPKPFDPDELVLAVKRGVETRALRLENARLRTETSLRRPIVAESPALRRVLDVVARVAPKDVTVLLTGESGVGKDVLAATLHAHSKRADKPLIRFNAAAIPSELAEAELFGHSKGAFTGAHAARLGYFQQADKGTLFIDEIGELPLAMQAKILARHPVGRGAAGGRAHGERRRAPRRRDEPRPRRRGEGRALPRGPLLSPQRGADPRAAAPRAPGGHRAARSRVRAHLRRSLRHGAGRRRAGARRGVQGTQLAGQRARAREHGGTPPRAHRRRQPHARPVALARCEARRRARASRSRATRARSHPLRARVEGFERSIIAAEFEAANKNQSETARRLGVSRPALIEKLHKYSLLDRG